jgi:endonuclease/exonuclease/phosphatase family metal-dependent hydrolase
MYWLLAFFGFTAAVRAVIDTQCPIAPAVPLDRRLNKDRFRIVQYNAEWLFTETYSNCPGSGCSWANDTEAEMHLEVVAGLLAELDADYVNFCEVEGCDELNKVLDIIDPKRLEYAPYLIKGTDTATGQNVGAITRIDPLANYVRTEDRYAYPIDGSKCGYTGAGGTTGVSKHYYTLFEINEIPVAIIAAHLLAFPTDKTRCATREAQAQVLQTVIVNMIRLGNEVIMMGDFNDFDFEIIDVNDDIPTSKVLDILKGLAGDYAGEYKLRTAGEKLQKEERYTEWWDKNEDCQGEPGEFSTIDHILMTPGLYMYIENVSIYHNYGAACGNYESDHYPVIVDFVF